MHRLHRRTRRARPTHHAGSAARIAPTGECCAWMRFFAPLRARLALDGRVPGLLLMLMLGGDSAGATEKPAIFGVFPKLTARQTVAIHLPVAQALEKQLGRPVVVYSARNFKTFVERTRRGEYDILLAAPHLAWLAHQDTGYRPLLKYAEPTRGLLVVGRNSPYRAPEEMRGRTIATADAIAVAVLAVQAEMAAHGLKREIDYHTNDAGTHLNAVMQVLNRRADAAMLGLHPYLLLPPEVRRRLRVIAATGPLSSLMYLTHPRLRDQERAAVRRGLLGFAATAEGARFLERGGYGGFVPVEGNDLQAFQPYAVEAQEILRRTR